MGITWTAEAEEALSHAPWILRPMIRRRMESEAQKARLEAIDLAFLQRIREQQGRGSSQPQPTETGDRTQRIADDVQFLAELLQRFCTHAHADAERNRVPPSGALKPYLPVSQAPTLCSDCRKLFLHAGAKRTICPHEPKPSCRNCSTPCHLPAFRAQLAEIMVWNVEQPAPLTRE